MTRNRQRIEALVMRMQRDFLETPALRLPLPEAQRRFGVDTATCEVILGVLFDAGVLTRTSEGAYARRFPRRESLASDACAYAA